MRGDLKNGIFAADGLFWRRLAHTGASRGPEWLRRYSPPLFGLAFAAAMPSARKTIAANLHRIRGEGSAVRDAIDIARTFTSYASCLAEALAGEAGPPAGAVIHGERQVLAALDEGRGAIFATAHTGGWDIAGPLLTRDHGHPIVLVMERERDAAARQIQDGARSQHGVRIVHVGGDELEALPLLRQLRSGGIVALQIDRVPSQARSVDVTMFGRPAAIPEGPLRLAQLSGAPILPIFAARTSYRRYVIRAFEPIRLARRAPREEVAKAAQRLADGMSAFLVAHPTQWFHFHE